MAVRVLAWVLDGGAVVASESAVGVELRVDEELGVLAELDGAGVVADEELDGAFQGPVAQDFAGVHGCAEDNLLLAGAGDAAIGDLEAPHVAGRDGSTQVVDAAGGLADDQVGVGADGLANVGVQLPLVDLVGGAQVGIREAVGDVDLVL